MVSSWLTKQGYDLNLQKKYRKSGWLESFGRGAVVRAGDQVGYEGGIYALQNQIGSDIHPGGKTALSLLGKSQYLELSPKSVTLFGKKGKTLPAWFKNRDWGFKLDYRSSGFLPANIGLTSIEIKDFQIKISGAARALMECLYLAPDDQDIYECYEIMENLNNLRPDQVQKLLETCQSIKVNRLFMFLAEKAGHDWVQFINLKKVKFGNGVRSIVKNGYYDSKYKIMVPQNLKDRDEQSL